MRRWVAWLLVAGTLALGAGLRLSLQQAPMGFPDGLRLPAWLPGDRAVITVWFPDAGGRFLVPVARRVRAATPAAAVQEWAAGPQPGQPLAPPLPPGIRLVGHPGDGDGTVRLSAQPGAGQPTPLQLQALARTLAGVPGGAGVRVTLNGRPLALPDPWPGGGEGTVKVYYLWQGLPVPVVRPVPPGQDPRLAAVREVLAGEPPAGIPWLPAGVDLESLTVRRGVATVQLRFDPVLAARVEAGEWNFAPYYMAIVYTLTEFPDIGRVRFAFSGLTAAALRQCRTPLGVPIGRPPAEPARGAVGEPGAVGRGPAGP